MLSSNHSFEYFFTLTVIIGSYAGSIFILKKDWKRYGLLYLISAAAGILACVAFMLFDFYYYPVTPYSLGLPFPFTAIVAAFPFYVLVGVNFSPRRWVWKLPFYMAMINLGVFGEILLEEYTEIIEYIPPWDTWDSYSAWWLYFLGMEYIGGMVVPESKRNPLQIKSLRYGRWGWIVTHIIFILTIFFTGVYFGMKL